MSRNFSNEKNLQETIKNNPDIIKSYQNIHSFPSNFQTITKTSFINKLYKALEVIKQVHAKSFNQEHYHNFKLKLFSCIKRDWLSNM